MAKFQRQINFIQCLGYITACLVGSAFAAEQEKLDNGTDPTRVSNTFVARFEHIALRNGFDSNILRLRYTKPVGERKNYILSLEIPVSSVDVLGNRHYDLGDVVLGLTHVFGLTREGGYVLKGELALDTANRCELGTGKNVFKGTFVRAWFHSDGSIFAPAFVQENSFSGESNRAGVNRTTADFYYVPKMADPRNLVTFDPNIVHDWEAKQTYGGLAVTFGRVLGSKAFGGNQIVSIKPSVFVGGDRTGKWGVEVAYKLIGF